MVLNRKYTVTDGIPFIYLHHVFQSLKGAIMSKLIVLIHFSFFQVVRQCAQKEGYDLDLSYRILAICAANGDKFQPQAAGLYL